MRLIGTSDLPHYLQSLFERFDDAFAQAPEQHVALIGGTRFDCRTDLKDYATTLRTALAGGHAEHGSTCRVLVACGGSLGLPPVPVWAERHYRERVVEAALAGSRYRIHYHHDLGFWQFYDRDTHRGIQLLTSPEGCPAWDSGSPLRNFLHWHFAARGLGLIHAGSLAVGGLGILLSGPGGSGKSGTVLAGIGRGLNTVGDDYVLVSLEPKVTAQPLFKTLKQDPAGFKRLGLSTRPSLSAALNWQGKHQFTLADLACETQPDQIAIKAICLPVISGTSHTRFEPVERKEAFLAVTPSGVTQMPGDRQTTFVFGARLARLVPTYRMRLGTDPDEISRAVTTFINSPLP